MGSGKGTTMRPSPSRSAKPVRDPRPARLIYVSHGVPGLVDALPAYMPNRLTILGRFWEKERAFSSSEEFAYQLDPLPTFSLLQRIGAHTVYNPRENVKGEWRPVGPYSKGRLIELVAAGLETDDDIIQQWFDGDDVLRLLEAAQTYDDVLLAVGAIGGGHEVDELTAAFVRSVLGSAEVLDGPQACGADAEPKGKSILGAAIQFLEPWIAVGGPTADNLEEELAREVGDRHPLKGCTMRAIARRVDCDDVLFISIDEPKVVAVVHLTWAARPETDPHFPWTTFYASMEDWVGLCMKPDHDELIS